MLLNCDVGVFTHECPFDFKEIHPVHCKGHQSWVFIGRTDIEADTLILWPPDVKSWLIRKDPDVGKDWGQEEKGMTLEDEMVGWHHWLNGHEFGWTPGVGDGQGGLVCWSSWGSKESDTTEWLNWLNDCFWCYYKWNYCLTSFSNCSLLVYLSTTNFCMSTLYPARLLNLFGL